MRGMGSPKMPPKLPNFWPRNTTICLALKANRTYGRILSTGVSVGDISAAPRMADAMVKQICALTMTLGVIVGWHVAASFREKELYPDSWYAALDSLYLLLAGQLVF